MGAAHTSPDFSGALSGVEMDFYHKLGRFVLVLSGLILPEPQAESLIIIKNPPGRSLLQVHLELGKHREAAACKSEGEASRPLLIFPVQALTCGIWRFWEVGWNILVP